VTDLNRRDLLKLSLLGGAGLLAQPALARAGEPTPPQTEGPFHPLRRGVNELGEPVVIDRRVLQHLDTDSDLTFVSDQPGTARGQLIYVAGRVLDEVGQPVDGALIEIWQACVSGRYNHRSDPNEAWLDPHFQYWGRTATDAEGRFLFRTVLPGAYRANASWIRPPHIHCKLSRRGFEELTTQVYFTGLPFYYRDRWWSAEHLARLNAADAILDGVPEALRPQVVSAARDPLDEEDLEASAKVFSYDLTLRAVSQPEPGDASSADPLLNDLLSR
jgi:protocatechuate 3,4-dioxygenase beta subunit